MRVVTSINHLLIKFPTPNKIGCLQGYQSDSRECYVKALCTAEHTYKHVLLAYGGPPMESCYKYVGTSKEEGERQVGQKGTRSTCNMIMIVQHPGEALYTYIALSLGICSRYPQRGYHAGSTPIKKIMK